MEFRTLLFPVHCLTGCLYRYYQPFFFFFALSFKMCLILLRGLVMCAVILSFPTLLPTIILITVQQGELPCFIFYERQSRITNPRFDLLWSGMVVRPVHPSRKIRNSSILLRDSVSRKPINSVSYSFNVSPSKD